MNLQEILHSLFVLIIFGLILGILFWATKQLGLPEPFGKIVRVLLVVLSAMVCIDFLLGLAGYSFIPGFRLG